MRLIEDLFEMGAGYVLDFSDRTFASFFAEELKVDIDSPTYKVEGTSKAKRLRYFLRSSASPVRIKTLAALWEYRQALRRRMRTEDPVPDSEELFWQLIERLGGKRPASRVEARSTLSSMDLGRSHLLRDEHVRVSQLEAHERGYAYERFLRQLFDVNGLAARASFRLVGEQIDGSFVLASETYLLEAKWQGPRIGAEALHAFHGKLEEKAAWSRGLFVSESGFTGDGLIAFGRGKRVVCMDGLDLHEMLERGLAFTDVMAAKVRRAAESGSPFVPLRDLNM